MRSVIPEVSNERDIPWETIAKLISTYNVKEDIKNSWLSEILTAEELDEYTYFITDLQKDTKGRARYQTFQKNWSKLTTDVKRSLHLLPHSNEGIKFGERFMTITNALYGSKYAYLRTKQYEAFKQGRGLAEKNLTTETISWLENAVAAYWQNRIHNILTHVGITPDREVLTLWNLALSDMYGDDKSRHEDVYQMILNNYQLSPKARTWLETIR